MFVCKSPVRDPLVRAARSRYRRLLLRPIVDALGAGLIFVLVTTLWVSAPVKARPFSGAVSGIAKPISPQALKAVAESGPAPVIEIATTSSVTDPDAVFRRTSSSAAWILLGLSFSALVALNLSFFRHLSRVYAVSQPLNRDVK